MKEGWKELFFKDFIKLNRGFDLPNNMIEEGGYPVIASTSIKAYHKNFKVKAPCVVTGRSGSLGVVQYVNQDGWPLNTSLYVKDFKGNNPKFVYYFLQTMNLDGFNSGAGVPTLNQNHLHYLKIFIPKDVNHQKRIASILSAYDDLIEVNNKRIELLEQSARELYKEWFVRMRFPNYQNAKFNKGIPEGWKEEYLGNILELAYGKALKEEDRTPGLYPVYGSSGIVGYHIEPFIKSSSIIVGRKGNVGSVFFSFKECFPIDTVFYVISDYSKFYLYQLLKEQTFIEGDAAVPGLNRNQAYKNKILHPTKKLIDQYDINIHPIFDQIENLQKQNQELAEIRNRLLPRLISGKLEVKA